MPPGFWGGREVWEFRLEMRKILFSGSPEGRYTLVPSFIKGTETTLSWVCLPWGKGKLFQDNCLTTSFSEPRAGERVGQLKTRGDKSVHEGEQVSLKEFPGWVDVGESSDRRPVYKFDGCLETLPVSLSEMPDLTAVRWFSDNSQRDVHFDKHVVRRTDWSRGRAADIVREICQNQIQKR